MATSVPLDNCSQIDRVITNGQVEHRQTARGRGAAGLAQTKTFSPEVDAHLHGSARLDRCAAPDPIAVFGEAGNVGEATSLDP